MSETVDPRRRGLVAGVGAALAWPGLARAAWPERPIRLVIPSAAGGSPDVICRIVTAELGRQLGQAFVIENRPGASGLIGMQEIARAAPDGHTFGYANVVTLSINRSLHAQLPYDPDRQFAPVALLGAVPNALVVRNDLPAKTVAELIALARARPGRLAMGSGGNGTTGHLGGELFKSMTGTYIVHVPYRGSPQAIQDLIGGRIDLMFDNLTSIAPHIQAGRVRALGVSGRDASPLFPELPPIARTVEGYETTAWGGIVAPAGTPRDRVTRMNAEINRALAAPDVAERLRALAFDSHVGPPERLFERALREAPMWAAVIRRSGAKAD